MASAVFRKFEIQFSRMLSSITHRTRLTKAVRSILIPYHCCKEALMTLWTRIQMFFSIKTRAALDRMEDPRETLEHAYDRQREMLRQVKQGLVEVATSRRQMEHHVQRLRERVPQLEAQA